MSEILSSPVTQIAIVVTATVTSALIIDEIHEQRKNGNSPIKLFASALWRVICVFFRAIADFVDYLRDHI